MCFFVLQFNIEDFKEVDEAAKAVAYSLVLFLGMWMMSEFLHDLYESYVNDLTDMIENQKKLYSIMDNIDAPILIIDEDSSHLSYHND